MVPKGITVDSGVAQSVTPPSRFLKHRAKLPPRSQAWLEHVSASGCTLAKVGGNMAQVRRKHVSDGASNEASGEGQSHRGTRQQSRLQVMMRYRTSSTRPQGRGPRWWRGMGRR